MFFITLSLLSVIAAQTPAGAAPPASTTAAATASIHGKAVTPECLQAYTDAFAPELARTAKFEELAAAVTTPVELKDRAAKASKALRTYQDALKKFDAKLSDPLTDADKAELKAAQAGTDDISGVMAEVSQSKDEKVTAAVAAFLAARKTEVEAGGKVEKACPMGTE